MPPSDVKPYVKRQKNDMADAEAICEAVTRPSMRFVPVKSPAQQSVMVLHRTRSILIRQRTQLSNAIRGHMGEFGLAAAVGRRGLQTLIAVIADPADERLPQEARGCLSLLVDQLRLVNEQILETDRLIRTSARATRGRPPVDGDPGRRPAAGQRPGRHHRRSERLPLGPQSRGLDRPRAAADLQRWQRAAERHHQAGRPLSATDVGRRRSGGRPLRRAQWHAPALAGAVARPTNAEGRRRRARQQDRPDGLGDHDPRRALSGAGGGRAIRPGGTLRPTNLGRADAMSCDSRSIPEDGTTHLRQSASSACFWSGPVFAEGIMARGHAHRINRSNTWPHRPGSAERQITLANGEPSTWRKADIGRRPRPSRSRPRRRRCGSSAWAI